MIPRTIFTTEHALFRATVQRFIAEEVTPFHADWEKVGEVPRSLWHKAAELGLLCCNVPESYGGMGGDFLMSAILVEEFALAGATGPTFFLHSDIVAPYLADFGTEEQKQTWLPRMASGEAIGALGMSEPSGGSDVQAMRTRAIRDGDDYVINGQKVFITNGHTLANFQNTRFEIAALHAETLAQRVFIDRCTELHLSGEFDPVDAAAAKLVSTELQGRVMDRCLQLFGGWGYMWEMPITRAYADARMTRIGGGAVEVMKQIIANSLLPRARSRSK